MAVGERKIETYLCSGPYPGLLKIKIDGYIKSTFLCLSTVVQEQQFGSSQPNLLT